MATELNNQGRFIRIKIGEQEITVLKSSIKEISIVRDQIIKIDTGRGSLRLIYIDRANVSRPPNESVEDLRDQLIAMASNYTLSAFALLLKTVCKGIGKAYCQILISIREGINNKVF